jgi:hypothetical protein
MEARERAILVPKRQIIACDREQMAEHRWANVRVPDETRWHGDPLMQNKVASLQRRKRTADDDDFPSLAHGETQRPQTDLACVSSKACPLIEAREEDISHLLRKGPFQIYCN